MSPQAEGFAWRRGRWSTLFVYVVATAWIALANWSAEPATIDFVRQTVIHGKSMERAYGWPFIWYWRTHSGGGYWVPVAEYDQPQAGFWENVEPPWKPDSPISRHSAHRLAANAAVWLTILAALWIGCRWLPRRYRLPITRPRIPTLLAPIIVSVLTVLANLSCDVVSETGASREFSYGWPLIWYKSFALVTMSGLVRQWDYSEAALAGNVAVLLTTLAATGVSANGWRIATNLDCVGACGRCWRGLAWPPCSARGVVLTSS